MKIHRLQQHLTNNRVDFYCADLIDDGITIHVRFISDDLVMDCETKTMYPIRVAGGTKTRIAEFNNGDRIELGIAIQRDK